MELTQYLVIGTNRGIGLEFVRQLLKISSNKVIATYRDPNTIDALKSLATEQENQGRLELLCVDMGDEESCQTAAAEVKAKAGALDILIINAGVFIGDKSLLSQDIDEIAGIFGTNVLGPLRICRAFVPLLKARPTQSKLLLMSSNFGSLTLGKNTKAPSYSISKAGLNMMGRKLAHELESANIAVGLLHPGWVQTDMGGPNADVMPQESVSGMLKVIEKVNMKNSGELWFYSGEHCPW